MDKRFRLVSMYIGDFRCLKHQVIQFCSDYTTSIVCVSSEKLHLKVKHQQMLPDDFFALNEKCEGTGCVNSVSAIIGKNGDGKTTIASLLCSLPASDDRKPSWKIVMVYEINGTIKGYSTFQQVVVETNEGVIKCDSDLQFNWPYRFFYYSPYFTTEQFDVYTNGYHADLQTREEGEVVSDISTTRLMLHPEGNSELLLRGGNLQSSIFDADEKVRLLEFIAYYYQKNEEFMTGVARMSRKQHQGNVRNPLNKFSIPKPAAITIGIHVEGFLSAVRDIAEKVESCRRDESGVQKKVYKTQKSSPDEFRDPVGEYLRTLIEPFERFQKSRSKYGFVINAFMVYAARYIQECGMFNASFPIELLQNGFLPVLREFIVNGGWQDDAKIKLFLKNNPPHQPHGSAESHILSTNNPLLELIELLQELCAYGDEQVKENRPTVRLDRQQLVLICRLNDDKVLRDVCRLVTLHGQARLISSFLKFDVLPHMSSGEMSFLMLFARLFHFVRKVPTGENVVVFLDEAETTLHPEWQCCLVAYCIRFFEVFLPHRQYQLIFASHSPMLLSDIPKGNVCCLYRDKKGNRCVRSIAADNTFAANIYDLFHSSYFLARGPIGEFAQTKIRGITKNDKEEIVKLVGDEVLKKLLQRSCQCVKW